MVATAAAPLLLLAAVLPRPLVLPALCLIAIAAACAAALFAWRTGAAESGPRITAWDVAGGLVFIGFAAGILSNPEHVVQLADVATSSARGE